MVYYLTPLRVLNSLAESRGLETSDAKDVSIARLWFFDIGQAAQIREENNSLGALASQQKSRGREKHYSLPVRILKQRILEHAMFRDLSAQIIKNLAQTRERDPLITVLVYLQSVKDSTSSTPYIILNNTISGIVARVGRARRGRQVPLGPPSNLSTVLYSKLSPMLNLRPVLANASSLTNFPLFSKLPAELRLRVWRYLMPRPRIIQLHHFRGHLRSCQAAPVILHICEESRAEALKTFKLCFTIDGQGGAYFDTSLDTLYIGFLSQSFFGHRKYKDFMDFLIHMADTTDLASIQNVALAAWHRGLTWQEVSPNTTFVPSFTGLRKVTFCLSDRDAEWGRDLALVNFNEASIEARLYGGTCEFFGRKLLIPSDRCHNLFVQSQALIRRGNFYHQRKQRERELGVGC